MVRLHYCANNGIVPPVFVSLYRRLLTLKWGEAHWQGSFRSQSSPIASESLMLPFKPPTTRLIQRKLGTFDGFALCQVRIVTLGQDATLVTPDHTFQITRIDLDINGEK